MATTAFTLVIGLLVIPVLVIALQMTALGNAELARVKKENNDAR